MRKTAVRTLALAVMVAVAASGLVDLPVVDLGAEPAGATVTTYADSGPPGSSKGSWHNPQTGESLHPDLGHSNPIGPHYDWRAPDGSDYRVFPDGRVVPK